MAKGVRTTHREYDDKLELWQRCDDTIDGQRAIHRAGVRYLPKLAQESPDDYKARVSRSDFFGASWRTIACLQGMAFAKDPAVSVPASIEPYLKNIDLAGKDATTLAKGLVEDVLEYGRVGVLVDHPPVADNVTAISLQVAEELGMRPALKVYDATSIINWRYKTIGNTTVLAMVVLKEQAEVQGDSEFEWACEDRYRVLDLDGAGFYRQRVFRINGLGEDELIEGPVYPVMRAQKMAYIPFFIIGANGIQTKCDDPPLIDLIDANIAHYQVNSDYRHGLHFTGLPTLFLAGIQQDEPIYIGGQAAVLALDPNARGEFIEFKGTGLGAMERALSSLERRMAALGAQMLVEQGAREKTATEAAINASGENSILAAIVIAVSDVIERALRVMAEWVGATGEVIYQINREFLPVPMDAQRLTALVAAWQAGAISDADLFDNLQRGDVIDGGKDFEQHQSEVDVSAAMPKPAANDLGVAA